MIFYEEIFKAFQEQKVKYILVGGLAVNLLGAMRTTSDMDILVEMSDENLKKIVEILKSRGYRVKYPVDPLKLSDPHIREEWINKKHMKAFNFYKDDELKEVDLIIESPVTYEDAKKDTVNIKVGDLILPVISLSKLIKMKKVSGRNIDELDIKELNRLKKLKNK